MQKLPVESVLKCTLIVSFLNRIEFVLDTLYCLPENVYIYCPE